ncbi:tRNA (adenine(22)-N(1))-methyltransferase [Lactobacillus helsingborgensis]|uniref:tRNA (adenine(22)-N(1))-methyltransferase n=1 Tax=Lactobacillus helsingborgensis TaxID=1218494 RepID=UPI001CC70F29|nr:class I SAM-dependent methyltransferase [Lactobacillus helsingborgensis]UZX30703.1 class I SAM-dependent methyltransferase [Lactobacillus helsingborgensis]
MNLRLRILAQMVDQEARVADIGTDHAYLPIQLVKEGKVDYAIASDVAAGPLQNAEKDIVAAGLKDKIETRLGSGLETVSAQDRIDTVVIAGMGGKLMTNILDEAWSENFHFATLILEPNVGEPGVREWLSTHKYQIIDEKIISEAGHIYELIKAQKVESTIRLTDRQIFFGPEILKEKNQVFYQKWQDQLAYHQRLLSNLNKAQEKDRAHIRQIEDEIKMIEGELND